MNKRNTIYISIPPLIRQLKVIISNSIIFHVFAMKSLFSDSLPGFKWNICENPLGTVLNTLYSWLHVIKLFLSISSTGKGVRDRLVNSGDEFNRCCHMVLCGWDYNLTTEKAAMLKHKNLYNEFYVSSWFIYIFILW